VSGRAASGEPELTARRAVLVWLALVAAALLLRETEPYQRAEAVLLDAQFRALRALAPRPASADVVILGIDEATLDAFPEPLAMWHRPLATLLDGLRIAGPRAVGVDVQLPARSYDALQPGLDRALFDALRAAAHAYPLVVALGVDQGGALRPVHGPFLAAAGPDGQGLATWTLDIDGAVRRLDEHQGEGGARVPTLTGTIARRLGAQVPKALIDYAQGDAFDYVPAHAVVEWTRNGDAARLTEAFAGRIVMLGSVLPFEDRHRIPVPLAAWEDSATAPGVLIHAQALRSLLGEGPVLDAPLAATLALVALGCALWFAGMRIVGGVVLFTVFVVAAVAASTVLLWNRIHLPAATAVLAGASSLALRLAYEAWFNRQQRMRLRRAFAGAVSPNVLKLILRGELESEIGSGRRRVAVMFGDIRGFTPMTESSEPEEVVALLNRYFSRITAAVHAHQGTIDNFRGDGIMCIFGAPLESVHPCRDGFDAAQDILRAVADLNRELQAEGRAPIRVGLSLAYGDAVVGRIGAADRNEYTAIGDVANVAARIEGLTAELGYPLLVDERVAAALAPAVQFDTLGERTLKGHSPVRIHGWPAGLHDTRSVREIAA
jgi:class 3 adenylate cyclase